ncbi:MAG: gfo/Idh/MocA family oxidoreductase [Chloroflexi bacterium]|nr:MAG: gfo/Idh/MocA family oxidoreductase [Chloroflexota bacterium]
MHQSVGIGIVGCGSIGIRGALDHFVLADMHGIAHIAACCDPVPGRAAAAAEKYGVPSAYTTEDELFADSNVDMVIICSPIGLHYNQGVKAINAGKHIHFNKTMTVTSAEANDLIARANAKGVHIVASPGQMLRPTNHKIRETIQSGGLGKLSWSVAGAAFGSYHEAESVRTGDSPLTNINPSWYWRKPGGGPLYDMTVYALHSLTGVLGPVKRVAAMSGVGIAQREFMGEMYDCDADDNTVILADFGNNIFSFIHGTFAGMVSEFGQPSYFGEHGTIVGTKINGEPIDYPGKSDGLSALQVTPHVKAYPAHGELGEHHVWEDSMQLVRWIREGKPSIVTAEHAAHVIEIIEAGYRAAQTGQTQTLTTTFDLPDDLASAS